MTVGERRRAEAEGARLEQLLHPDRLLAGALPLPLEEPQPDGEVVERGVLGELGLTILLASVLEPATARIAADGWGADRYVAWSDGPLACIRASFLADSPTDSEELTRALADWVGRRPPGTLGRASPS